LIPNGPLRARELRLLEAKGVTMTADDWTAIFLYAWLVSGFMGWDDWTAIFLYAWLMSGFMGWVAGLPRRSGIPGMLLGFIGGPLGILAALAVDVRPECPRCGGRVGPTGVELCQHCRSMLVWRGAKPIGWKPPNPFPPMEE
jgi:hypothetical protein